MPASRTPPPGAPNGSPPRSTTPWQLTTLETLRTNLPTARITPYGSATEPSTLDGWSDLDVQIAADSPVDVATALGSPIWTYQHIVESEHEVVRVVLADGRRADLTITGGPAVLPAAAADSEVRFDAALAAVRFGRGSDLIGLHLTLGILRQTLVQGMLRADRDAGTTHHRHANPPDADAAGVLEILQSPLGPATAREAYLQYGRWRQRLDPAYAPDARGLDALIRRGTGAAS
ncbi:hypothetical protein DEO23_09455 [Brachybacterium endophyticum]|uniref:Nucleotidyltransferase n=1 Tax=Brachybacterium endophyticum TaxID=2182385 RepID=A0A2U2RJS6_9MICO|nr:hypothetical protein [Brachybacterium endophyticum]PWH06034.1 hypothetical protein DEO23_09455 [Brachybacterium endophyticum]